MQIASHAISEYLTPFCQSWERERIAAPEKLRFQISGANDGESFRLLDGNSQSRF